MRTLKSDISYATALAREIRRPSGAYDSSPGPDFKGDLAKRLTELVTNLDSEGRQILMKLLSDAMNDDPDHANDDPSSFPGMPKTNGTMTAMDAHSAVNLAQFYDRFPDAKHIGSAW